MKKPIVFFHIATIGKYTAVTNEIMGAMIASGLYEYAEMINFSVVGGSYFDMWWTSLGITKDARISSNTLESGEAFALGRLREAAMSQPDHPFLYLHTKGVANGADNPCIDEWRRYMTHFCVGQWRRCNTILDVKDAVGVDWRTEPAPHFSGNFWWARGDYLAKLKPVGETPVVLSERHKAEFWIGTGNPMVFSLHDCGHGVYERHLNRYPMESYV